MSVVDKFKIGRMDTFRVVASVVTSICMCALGVITQETSMVILCLGAFTLSEEAVSKGKVGSLLSVYALSLVLSILYLVCYSLVTT